MKAPILLAAFIVQHSAFGIAAAAGAAAAEPPPAAAQEGVQLWEDGPYWADRNIGADEPWEPGLHFWWGDTVGYKRENNAWAANDGSSTNFSFANAEGPNADCTWRLHFGAKGIGMDYCWDRHMAMPVRPVRDE